VPSREHTKALRYGTRSQGISQFYLQSANPSFIGQPFFYMAFACCVNIYMVSVHTSST